MCVDNDEICDIVDYQKKFEILNTFEQDSRSEDVSAQFQYYGQCKLTKYTHFDVYTERNAQLNIMLFQLQVTRKTVIIQVILIIQYVSNKQIPQPLNLETLPIN